jgi:hypothetical protein
MPDPYARSPYDSKFETGSGGLRGRDRCSPISCACDRINNSVGSTPFEAHMIYRTAHVRAFLKDLFEKLIARCALEQARREAQLVWSRRAG